MSAAIEYMKKLHIPVTSTNEAGVYVSRHMDSLSIDEYDVHIMALAGSIPTQYTNRKQHHLTLAYLCQLMVKQYIDFGACDGVVCYPLAISKVDYHSKHNKFFFTEDAPNESSRNVVDGVTRPQGWKRSQAIQFLRDNKTATLEQFRDHCVNTLEMSPAGANAYWYMAYQEVFGKKAPAGARGKKKVEGTVSRREQATQLMRTTPDITRQQFIDKCVSELEMSVACATTYYYSAYNEVHGTAPPKLPRGKAAHKK